MKWEVKTSEKPSIYRDIVRSDGWVVSKRVKFDAAEHTVQAHNWEENERLGINPNYELIYG
jgi:hypothetical protein